MAHTRKLPDLRRRGGRRGPYLRRHGSGFRDYNNDNLPDLVITDLASQMYALYRTMEMAPLLTIVIRPESAA